MNPPHVHPPGRRRRCQRGARVGALAVGAGRQGREGDFSLGPCERLEELDDVRLLARGELEGFHLAVEGWVRVAAPIVELDEAQQGRLAAVVHVGEGLFNLAAGRRLEGPDLGVIFGTDRRNHEPAEVGEFPRLRNPADTEVMELLVGEIGPGMAGRAVRLLERDARLELVILAKPETEQDHASLGAVREFFERLGTIAAVVAVILRVAREDGSFEGGNGLGHAVEGDVGAEDLAELVAIAGDRPQTFNDLLVRLIAHLDLVLYGPLGLAFERRGAAIPEHREAVNRVQRQ